MVPRARHLERVEGLLRRHPVVAIIGARQVGKTTLAQEIGRRSSADVVHFDLENPAHRARLEDPMLALQNLEGLVILDEIQQRPELFPVLRVLADRPESAKFLNPRQCLSRAPSAELRDAGRPHRLLPARRLSAGRGRCRAPRPTLAAGRLPALLPRRVGRRRRHVPAGGAHPGGGAVGGLAERRAVPGSLNLIRPGRGRPCSRGRRPAGWRLRSAPGGAGWPAPTSPGR